MTKYRLNFTTLILGIMMSSSLASGPVFASEANADVINVKAVDRGAGGWTFHVTVLHPDTGWDDYCNGWDVVSDQGEVIKKSSSDEFTRLLLHPHEQEQPFTRSQSGLEIPPGVRSVTVRAHDLVHGFGGREVEINLSQDQGDGFTIIRQ